MITDERLKLFQHAQEPSVFIHRSEINGFDSVHGPLACAAQRVPPLVRSELPDALAGTRHSILRLTGREAESLAIVPPSPMFVNYELVSPASDASIIGQRALVDAGITGRALADAPAELAERARTEFATIVRGLFRHTICSMTRIVLSARWPDYPGWIAATTRDREKLYDIPPDVTLIRARDTEPGGGLEAFHANGQLPTSGVVVAWNYHLHTGPGFLLHAHLLAPVLLDAAAGAMACIDSPPRSLAFADELCNRFARGYSWVLRRGEGIWLHGSTPEACVRSAVACQDAALELLY
ncbi:MAG TPA: hypothetical protein VHI13_22095 [Candidatus Kapabacteria bacterium]|nr:hypothetical protein [Candidatus Kapabacteria bacterium]